MRVQPWYKLCTFELVIWSVLSGYLICTLFLTFASPKSLTLQISSTPSNGWCREQVRFLQSCWHTRSWPAASTRWSWPPCSSAASGPCSNAASPSRRSTTTVDLHLVENIYGFNVLLWKDSWTCSCFKLQFRPTCKGDWWLLSFIILINCTFRQCF